MPECPNCERFFGGRQCPHCQWTPSMRVAPPPPPPTQWQPLTGPPLTKEQNLACYAIFKLVADLKMHRWEGMVRIGAMALSWGMEIPEDDDCYEDFNDRMRYMLKRVKELYREARWADLDGAYAQADLEADNLFPADQRPQFLGTRGGVMA